MKQMPPKAKYQPWAAFLGLSGHHMVDSGAFVVYNECMQYLCCMRRAMYTLC